MKGRWSCSRLTGLPVWIMTMPMKASPLPTLLYMLAPLDDGCDGGWRVQSE